MPKKVITNLKTRRDGPPIEISLAELVANLTPGLMQSGNTQWGEIKKLDLRYILLTHNNEVIWCSRPIKITNIFKEAPKKRFNRYTAALKEVK